MDIDDLVESELSNIPFKKIIQKSFCRNGLLASRNTSFFAILVVLVIFFALFYMYYAAANESTILQRELDAQSEHIAKLKNEILGMILISIV